ncbi:MAG: thrombospondin type 3 repeat-containing protein [Candidatus Polarisedimenticolia bacterium]
MPTNSGPRVVSSRVLAFCLGVLAWGWAGVAAVPPAQPTAEGVREAMLGIYVHGVDADLAASVLGPQAIPFLIDLLRDEGFPRRDNLVAFLAHLDAGTSTPHLVRLLAEPPVDPGVPEEGRAMLLAPQALGHIAARGDAAALDALLDMTADGSEGGVLRGTANLMPDPAAMRGDLLEMALRGLAFSNAPHARARLESVADGRIRPSRTHDLAGAARQSLRMMQGQDGSSDLPAPGPVEGIDVTDPAARGADSGLTYSNHITISNPMTNTRLDSVLTEATLRMGRSDFAADVACCASLSRSNSGGTVGTAGDGLGTIDSGPELTALFSLPGSRVKVVTAINWCSSPGMNIIGCARQPGNGMAVVRLSQIGSEAILWAHEYGHNAGLAHSADSAAIMFGTLTGGNNGLALSECNGYHNPHPSADMTTTDTGACGDSDADGVAETLDNCPFFYNPAQTDTDGDGQGDPCDGDADSDGVADAVDCADVDNQIWSIPSEVLDLQLTHDVGSGTVLSWSAPAQIGGVPASVHYDTIRSLVSSDFVTNAVCVETDDGPNTTAAAAPPPSPLWSAEGNAVGVRAGASVGAAGDFDADGFDDVVVGVPSHTFIEDREGRIVLYYGSATGPAAVSVTESNADFAGMGTSVDGAGNVNGDLYDDVITGAPWYDNGVLFGGAAMVYLGSPSGLPSSPSWIVSLSVSDAFFGQSVSGAGDVNDDGHDEVVVGAPNLNAVTFQEGGAFLYPGSPSGLAGAASWSPTGSQSGGRFGAAVAGVGDLNDDGFDDVAIGAPQESDGEAGEGRVHVFLGSGSGLSATPVIVLQGGQAGAAFGSVVAGAGDVNDDGFDDLLVGAPFYDGGQTDEGRAYLFLGSAAGVSAVPVWTMEADQVGALAGASVAGAGNMNGDARADIVVSAPGYDNDQSGEGRLYVFLGTTGGASIDPVMVLESNQFNSGTAMVVSGAGHVTDGPLDGILLGTPQFDNGQNDEGRAALFMGSTSLEPPAGSITYYYVRPRNGCGTGAAGFSSSGSEQPARSCP